MNPETINITSFLISLLKQSSSFNSVAIFQYPIIIYLPVCFGVIAIALVGFAYFNSISRNPTIEPVASNKLFILIGVIEGSVLACLGIGYIFTSGLNKAEADKQQKDDAQVEKVLEKVEQAPNKEKTDEKNTNKGK